jgi:hypothetical protein
MTRATEAVVDETMRQGRSTDAAFDGALTSGLLLGRRVKGMWIIEPNIPRSVPPVVRTYGSVPRDILGRHAEFLAGMKKRRRQGPDRGGGK